jgi:hypothetical protein
MLRQAVLSALITGLSFVAPPAALAGSAGGSQIPCEATQQLRYVEDTNGNGFRDSGENTACANPTFDGTDPDNPLIRNGPGGTICLPAIDASLRGTVTLIADDAAKDNDSGNASTAAMLLIEVRHDDQIYRLADMYAASNLGDLILGNWDNRLSDENNVFGVQFHGALFLTPAATTDGAFDDLGAALSQLAETLGLIGDKNNYLPIVANATRDGVRKRFVQGADVDCDDPFNAPTTGCGELESDQSGASEDLASIAVYRVTFSFAEKLTTAPPSCS